MSNEPDPRFGKVVARAWADEGFKQKLRSDPKSALSEFGIDLGSGRSRCSSIRRTRFTSFFQPRQRTAH